MVETQTLDFMKRDEDLDEELFVLCFQWQRKAIDDAIGIKKRNSLIIHKQSYIWSILAVSYRFIKNSSWKSQ